MRSLVTDERGQAMVEFTLAAVAFLMLVFAVIQFGLYMRARVTAQTAAVEAARVLARETGATSEAETRARDVLAAGLGGYAQDAAVAGVQSPDRVRVTVRVRYPLIIPFVPGDRLSTIQVNAEMRRERFRPGP